MKIFELKINGERKSFYKNLGKIKEYLRVIFGLNKKDTQKIGKLSNPYDIFLKESFILDNGIKIFVEVETHNLV